MVSKSASLPSTPLLEQQARWLKPARGSLLRRAAIAHRRSVLDLGAGRGMVTRELARRCSGTVFAMDILERALHETRNEASVIRIVGDAGHLPFRERTLDLVFTQFTLLWVGELAETLAEIRRVLMPGGHFCAIEPDYPALIEHPPRIAVSPIWLSALRRAGALVDVGRRLPGLLERQGFNVQVRLLDQLLPPSQLRFAMLRELPLTPEELANLAAAEDHATPLTGSQQISHLPLFLINASRPE